MRYPLVLIFVVFCLNVFAQVKTNNSENIIICAGSPQFPGGEKALYTFLKENLHYPKELCVEGKVLVSVTVEADGSLSNIRIVRSIHPIIDKECLEVVKKMPRWIPIHQNWMPVKCDLTIPILIRLD